MREIPALGEGADEVIHSSELGVRHDTHEQRRHQTNALFISPLQFLPERRIGFKLLVRKHVEVLRRVGYWARE